MGFNSVFKGLMGKNKLFCWLYNYITIFYEEQEKKNYKT